MCKRLKMLFELVVCSFWSMHHPLLGCRWLLQSLKSPHQKQGQYSYNLMHLHSSILEFTEAALYVGKTERSLTDQQTQEHRAPCGKSFYARIEHTLNPKLLTQCCVQFIHCIQRLHRDISLSSYPLYSTIPVLVAPLLVHYVTGTLLLLRHLPTVFLRCL